MTITTIASALRRRLYSVPALMVGLALALTTAFAPSAQARPDGVRAQAAVYTGAKLAQPTLVHGYGYGYRRGYGYPRFYYRNSYGYPRRHYRKKFRRHFYGHRRGYYRNYYKRHRHSHRRAYRRYYRYY